MLVGGDQQAVSSSSLPALVVRLPAFGKNSFSQIAFPLAKKSWSFRCLSILGVLDPPAPATKSIKTATPHHRTAVV